jgi:hypothetical protein
MRLADLTKSSTRFTGKIGKPHTVQGVYDRMMLRVLDQLGGYTEDRTCHSVAIDYVYNKAKDSDILVFVGTKSGQVTHSFVTDKDDNILADSAMRHDPQWDGVVYSFGKGYEYYRMFAKQVREIRKDYLYYEGRG